MTPLIAGLLLLVASLAKTVEPQGATVTLGAERRSVKRARLIINVKSEHRDPATGRDVYAPDPSRTIYWLSVELEEKAGEDDPPHPMVQEIPVRRAAEGRHPGLAALGALEVREIDDGKDCEAWGAWLGLDRPTLCRNRVRFQGWDGKAFHLRWDAEYVEQERKKAFSFEGPVGFAGVELMVKREQDADEFLRGAWGGEAAGTFEKHVVDRLELGESRYVKIVYLPKGVPVTDYWTPSLTAAETGPPPATRGPGRVADGRNVFSLELPTAWDNVHDAVFARLGGLSLRQAGPPEATLKAVAVEHPFKMTLDEYIENSTIAYSEIWEVEERASVTLGGAPAVRMVIRQEIGANVTRLLKYFVATKKGAVVITFATAPDSFAGSLAGFEAIGRTFQLAN
jgi:hypothetical protein